MNWMTNGHQAIALTLAVLLLAGCGTGADGPDNSPVVADPRSTAAPTAQSLNADEDETSTRENDKEVFAENLPYAEIDEQLVYGHFAYPDDMVDPLPAVIVIHERWGLDDGVRALANRIAGQGFVVLAIDLYGDRTATDISEARKLMVEVIENPEFANENIRQAYQFLNDSANAPRIASLGWSFGGGWALNAAMLLQGELDATVIYYGQVTDNEEKLAPIDAPILGLFGSNDRGVSANSVRGFEAALEKLEKVYEIEIYPDVGHAFADPGASNYNEKTAELAWARVVDFLNQHLVVNP